MADAASPIRGAIDKTSSEVVETVSALGQKADVLTQDVRSQLADVAREKGTHAKEHLADVAAQAVSKATDLRDQAAEQVPDRVPPAIGEAVDQARDTAVSATRGSRRRWVLGVTLLLVALAVIRARRMRGSA
jgi:hypothetical protein